MCVYCLLFWVAHSSTCFLCGQIKSYLFTVLHPFVLI